MNGKIYDITGGGNNLIFSGALSPNDVIQIGYNNGSIVMTLNELVLERYENSFPSITLEAQCTFFGPVNTKFIFEFDINFTEQYSFYAYDDSMDDHLLYYESIEFPSPIGGNCYPASPNQVFTIPIVFHTFGPNINISSNKMNIWLDLLNKTFRERNDGTLYNHLIKFEYLERSFSVSNYFKFIRFRIIFPILHD